MHRKLEKKRGFSLIELLVAIAITGVLLGVGVPSFKHFMSAGEMAETHNAMVYSLQVARSSSMERLEPAGLCASANPMANNATCATGLNYSKGWIVYVDADGDGVRDIGEDILERVDKPSPAFTFTPVAAFADQIYFNDSGASINVAGVPMSGTIGVDYAGGTEIRLITVSANGRVKTETP